MTSHLANSEDLVQALHKKADYCAEYCADFYDETCDIVLNTSA